MRYLVTGEVGFIGSYLAEAQLTRGDEVVVVDTFDSFAHAESQWNAI